MDKIAKYTVTAAIYRTSVESAVYQTELEAKVNALIAQGWQPFGSLQLVSRADVLIALQPMVLMDGDGIVASAMLREVETGGAA